MSGRIHRHQRTLVLLAGLLGVLIGTPAAAAGGSGAAELVRAGAAVAANSVRSQPAAGNSATVHHARPYGTHQTPAYASHLTATAEPAVPAHHGRVPPARTHPATAVAASPRQVRGPPSITGT